MNSCLIPASLTPHPGLLSVICKKDEKSGGGKTIHNSKQYALTLVKFTSDFFLFVLCSKPQSAQMFLHYSVKIPLSRSSVPAIVLGLGDRAPNNTEIPV